MKAEGKMKFDARSRRSGPKSDRPAPPLVNATCIYVTEVAAGSAPLSAQRGARRVLCSRPRKGAAFLSFP